MPSRTSTPELARRDRRPTSAWAWSNDSSKTARRAKSRWSGDVEQARSSRRRSRSIVRCRSGQVARSRTRQGPVLAQAVADGSQRQHPDRAAQSSMASGQPVELPADLGDHDRHGRHRELQVGAHAAGAIDEEAHRVRAAGVADAIERPSAARRTPAQPRSRRAIRLVTMTRDRGDAASRSPTTSAASMTCSKLSMTSRARGAPRSPRRRSAADPSGTVEEAHAAGDLGADQLAVAHGLEVDERRRRRRTRPPGARASSRARVVLPVPPGPVSVSRPRLAEEPVEGLELLLAPDERRQALRAAGRPAPTAAAQRRELAGQAGCLQLEQRAPARAGP